MRPSVRNSSGFLGERFQQGPRDADVGDVYFASIRAGLGETGFAAAERNCFGGANRGAEDLAGVRIKAGGNIDRHNAAAAGVGGEDDFGREAFDGAGEAGAEEAIDEDVGGVAFDDPVAEFGMAGGGFFDGKMHGVDGGELCGGGAGELVARGDEEDRDGEMGVGEPAGGDERVSAVVAGTGEDEDAAFRRTVGEEVVGDGAAGVFHEDGDREVVVVEGAAVELAEGGAGEDERGRGHGEIIDGEGGMANLEGATVMGAGLEARTTIKLSVKNLTFVLTCGG
jgi:hypothetical protein